MNNEDDETQTSQVLLDELEAVGALPLDADGFVQVRSGLAHPDLLIVQSAGSWKNDQSFDVDDAVNMRAFFDKYGFVAVRNVLSEDDVRATRDEFFAQFDRNSDESIEAFYEKQAFGPTMGLM